MEKHTKHRFKISFYSLLLIIIVLPFFFVKHYFNISEEKWIIFSILSIIFIFLIVSNFILDYDPASQIKDLLKDFGFYEWAMLALLGANIISLIVSEYTAYSFSGSMGRNHGFINFVFYALLFLIVRRSLTRKHSLILCKVLAVVGAFVSLFAILQYLEVDVFNMYVGVALKSKLSMISPIGNMNTYASYLNIVVPLGIYLFVISSNIKESILFGLCTAFGAMGGITSTSDSFYFGIIITPLLLFCSGILTRKELSRLPLAYAIGALADFLLISLANSMLNNGADIREGFGVTKYLNSHTSVLLAIALIALLLWLGLFLLAWGKWDKLFLPAKAGKVLTLLLILGFASVLLAWILGFPYKNEMGSYRGFIWNLSIKDFKASGLVAKLFGHGQETILMVFKDNYYEEMKSVTGVIYDNVHCEVLEYLLTTGIVGLLAYLAFVGGIFVKLFAALRANKDAMLFLLPTLCYFTQSFVNIAQSASTPIFFILLAMGANALQKDRPEMLSKGN